MQQRANKEAFGAPGIEHHDVTLTGNVDSQTKRSQAETVASGFQTSSKS